jgi:hypothetical protein
LRGNPENLEQLFVLHVKSKDLDMGHYDMILEK